MCTSTIIVTIKRTSNDSFNEMDTVYHSDRPQGDEVRLSPLSEVLGSPGTALKIAFKVDVDNDDDREHNS